MSVHSGRTATARRPPISSPNPKYERILEAAIQVFAEKGFYNARVNDIARQAEVADGTIYLYFKNKDDLLIQLFENRMTEIIARFRGHLAVLPTATQKLRRFIELQLSLVAEHPTLAEVLTVELRQSGRFMREYKAKAFGEYLDIIEEIVVEGQRAGEFDPAADGKILKRALFGALDEVSLAWLQGQQGGRPPFELPAAADQIWRACAHGFLLGRTEQRASPEEDL
jgi:TetR/AcrR family fatty acid metabolism transcriptional regulator